MLAFLPTHLDTVYRLAARTIADRHVNKQKNVYRSYGCTEQTKLVRIELFKLTD